MEEREERCLLGFPCRDPQPRAVHKLELLAQSQWELLLTWRAWDDFVVSYAILSSQAASTGGAAWVLV
jgi:hypothetical protein